MSNVPAECSQSLLITANRRLLCVALCTQIAEELLGAGRRPRPRIFVGESLEAPDNGLTLIDGRKARLRLSCWLRHPVGLRKLLLTDVSRGPLIRPTGDNSILHLLQ
jgi:hypothetical protein